MDRLYLASCVFSLFCCVLADIKTVTLNRQEKINCNDNKVIEIDNITVTEHATDSPTDSCTVDVGDKAEIKQQCNGYSSCNITSNLQTNFLKDFGYFSFNYTCQEILPVSCDFENGKCGWTVDNDPAYAWTTGTRKMMTSGISPNTHDGTIKYTNASKGSDGYVTSLKSALIKSGRAKCLTFWYHPFGKDVDNLRLYLEVEGIVPNSIWNASGSKENKWQHHQIRLDAYKGNYTIVFEAERRKGNVALDNIIIAKKGCEDKSKYAKSCLNVTKNVEIQDCGKFDLSAVTFYPINELCGKVYENVQHNIAKACSNIHTAVCNFNLSNALQKSPECFMPNKLKIEYACKAPSTIGKESQSHGGHDEAPTTIGEESQSQGGHDEVLIGGVIAGVILLACTVAVLIVVVRRSRNGNRETKPAKKLRQNDVDMSLTADYRNDYTGNQGIALPNPSIHDKQQSAYKKDDLQVRDGGKGKSRTDECEHEYTYIENTIEEGEQTHSRYEFVDSDTIGCGNRNGHGSGDKTNYSSSKDGIQSTNNESQLSIEGGNNSESTTTDAYMILDPNETGFNRSNARTNVSSQVNNESASHSKFSKKGNELVSEMEDSNDITYDTSNTKLQKEIETNIYSHTVDSVYDTAGHKQEDKGREDTYDHFLSERSEVDNGVPKDM